MTVEALAQTDSITQSSPPPNSLQSYSLESSAPSSPATNLLQPYRLGSAAPTFLPSESLQPYSLESAASFRLEIDAVRVLAALAAAICATGPIVWLLVRYWLFAP